MKPIAALLAAVLSLATAGAVVYFWYQQSGPLARLPSFPATAPPSPILLPAPPQPPLVTLPTFAVPDRINAEQVQALRQAVRRQASAINPNDLARLPQTSGPFSPLFEEPVPALAMLHGEGVNRSPVQPDGTSATNRMSERQANKNDSTSTGSSPGTSLFDPYPRGAEPPIPAPEVGYHPDVSVLAPGRLDWTFVCSHQSLDAEPSSLTAGYDSTRQRYELYVPPNYDPHRPYPMMIYVTPGGRSDAWGVWQGVCEKYGVILAGPHNAGNEVPMVRRCRVVLDVLDDVRRRYHIDPDRTYISGTSGGGNAASRIAFALPELFGGLAAIVGTWNLRLEPMVRRHVRERMSVAVVTGTGDFNGPEMRYEFYPVLAAHKARAKLWVYNMGHSIPAPPQLDEIFQWLEAGLPERRALAEALPNTRLTEPLSPGQWATATVLEAGQRLNLPAGTSSGLFFLQGVVDRWKGLAAAEVAASVLKEFDTYAAMPWRQLHRAELLRFRYLQSQMFDGTLKTPLPPNYPVPRRNLVEIGLALWREVRDLAPENTSIAREAQARIAALQKEEK